MTNRPAGPGDTAPWKPVLNRSQRPLIPPREADPCQGCRHLFVRYADGGAGRPACAKGVDYGQAGCVRRHGH